jgi:hypothetical protein
MGADLTGDWTKLLSVLNGVATKCQGDLGKKIGQSVKKIERKVLDHVDAQDLGWDELTGDYAESKERKGLSPDTLRASNQMYSNITTDQPDDYTGAVGVKRGVQNQDGEDVTDIAIIHEQPDNDGKKIPARKLWEPTFNEMKDEIPPEVMGSVKRMFEK